MKEAKEVKTIEPRQSQSVVKSSGISKQWSHHPDRKKKLVILLSVVVLAIILLAIGLCGRLILNSDNSGAKTGGGVVCSDKLLKAAKQAIDKNSTDKLSGIVQDIQNNKKYKEDPNCMYIVTKYYATKGDIKNMNSSMASFYKVYDIDKGLNIILSSKPSSDVKLLNDSVKQKNEQVDGVYSEVQSQL
ncbi:MAG: hypothetical protein M0R39_16880 [Prolixibacteraceae bacterium]|nr:hypothetical protein [Prolixibacteraceae bacterium]